MDPEAPRSTTAPDHVDHLIGQWRAERPELDTRGLEVAARVIRLQRFLERRAAGVLDRFGLTEGEMNVLAALRRSGPPQELTPTELYRSLLVSSGAMTNRLDRLVDRGLVRRTPDPDDRRRIRVGLTEAGRRVVDEAMDVHVTDLLDQLGFLTDPDRERLVDALRQVLTHLEGRDGPHG
jgi:DNA-binding MarR family transcriptional regulator